MERVPTWSDSPYVGTFQYKDAGPKRIHRKTTLPFFLPASPYLGSLRHNLLWWSPEVKKVSVSMQTEPPRTQETGVQTEDADLNAYVIVNYQPHNEP